MVQAPETASLDMEISNEHTRMSLDSVDHETTRPDIEAMLTGIPHENWSTIECRMWLLRVMRDYMGFATGSCGTIRPHIRRPRFEHVRTVCGEMDQ